MMGGSDDCGPSALEEEAEKFMAQLQARADPLSAGHSDNSNGRNDQNALSSSPSVQPPYFQSKSTTAAFPLRRRIRVVLPLRIATRQEQRTPELVVKNDSPDELMDPQLSPTQTPTSEEAGMSETEVKKNSPEEPKNPQQSPVQTPTPQEGVMLETEVKMNSPDEPDGPQRSPIQTPAPQGGMSEIEVIMNTTDEPKDPQRPTIQTPTPEEHEPEGMSEAPVEICSPDEPMDPVQITESPNASTAVSNLVDIPSTAEQSPDPIVKYSFYPPIVLKREFPVYPAGKSSPASLSGHLNLVSEDELTFSTLTKKHLQEACVVSRRKGTSTKSSKTSLVDRLNQYEKKKCQESEQKMKEMDQEKKKQPTSLSPVPQFIPGLVPDSLQQQKKTLPIYAVKDQLIGAIRNNQVVIVTGETGSGKSTQLPQYIAEAGLHGNGRIAVTQPRRVAAKSVATRVAAESGVELGTTVGYKIRLDRSFDDNTVIKFVTDAVLVSECTNEDTLPGYSVVVIDEAHERSIKTDICLGLLKNAAKKRPDLKIIISSATLEQERFLEYFGNAVIFEVTGKLYPIDIVYKPDRNYLCGAVDIVLDINRNKDKGDILVFLADCDEIEQVWEMIEARLEREAKLQEEPNSVRKLIIAPCYSGLPFEEQEKIFEPTPENYRKVVLATNIAETSLTIDGIKYVIDSGFYKQTEYNPKSDIYSLVRKQITKFQATQRCGRAGRTQPGTCYRLYSEEFYEQTMETSNKPEITRLNVETVVLDIMAMGIANPFEFEFMDHPSEEVILEALLHLKELSALDKELKLTQLGRDMSKFPVAPRLAKVILESETLGCVDGVLKIVAILNTQYHNLFKLEAGKRSLERLELAKERLKEKKEFYEHPDGVMLTLLKIYDTWVREGFSKDWCRDNFVQYGILNEAREIRRELHNILKKNGFVSEAAEKAAPVDHTKSEKKCESIHKAFTSGFFRQVANKKKWEPGHKYLTWGKPGLP